MSLDQSIQVSVEVGNRKLLTSGIIHTSGEDRIKVNVANLSFTFLFKSDDAESRFSGEVVNDELYLTLFNHNNSLGEGSLEPVEVATINNKILSLTYFTSALDSKENKRRFEYALYLRDQS